MMTEPTSFFSDGHKLDAAFMLPDDTDTSKPAPLVIPCSGFTGLMKIHPARFARSLTTKGIRCFAFDYRGFANSEGERGHVVLEEQVRDIRHAVAFASADARVDEDRIILLGWGMAGGLVLDAARALPGIIGLVAANGFFDGRRVQRAHRGDDGLATFEQQVRDERTHQARTGAWASADPFDLYPLDPESRAYVDKTLRSFDQYDEAERYTFALGDSLLHWRPEAYAPDMTTPLLIAHGDRNMLHPTSEVDSLASAYGGEHEVYWIEDAGHTDFMHDDDPRYQALASRVVSFVEGIVGSD